MVNIQASLSHQILAMTQLAPFQLEDGTVIYIEANEEVAAPSVNSQIATEEEESLDAKGWNPVAVKQQMAQNFQAIQGTIRAYTTQSLQAFKDIEIGNIRKVTLEFGLKIGGEAGIPYVTKGTAESNLKITVECGFNNESQKKP